MAEGFGKAKRRAGWPTVNVAAEGVVAIRPAMRHDGKRATNARGERLWVVYARVPDGTHAGTLDLTGLVVSSIAKNSQVVAYKDGSARLGDGVAEVTLSLRPDAPIPLYRLSGEGEHARMEEVATPKMGADELWGLARSIKQRRQGLDVPATDGQMRAISRLLPDGPMPEGLSKLEASTLIESLVAERPATAAQLEFLERLGYEGEVEDMDMREASEAIDGLLAESRAADDSGRDNDAAEPAAPTDELTKERAQIDSATMWSLISEGRLDEARAIVDEALGRVDGGNGPAPATSEVVER